MISFSKLNFDANRGAISKSMSAKWYAITDGQKGYDCRGLNHIAVIKVGYKAKSL